MTPEQIVADAIDKNAMTNGMPIFKGEINTKTLSVIILKALRDAGYLKERCPSNTREYTKEEMIEMFGPPEKE